MLPTGSAPVVGTGKVECKTMESYRVKDYIFYRVGDSSCLGLDVWVDWRFRLVWMGWVRAVSSF